MRAKQNGEDVLVEPAESAESETLNDTEMTHVNEKLFDSDDNEDAVDNDNAE